MALQIVSDLFNLKRQNTAKMNKRFSRKSTRHSLFKEAEATLRSQVSFRDLVKCPPGEDLDSFIAEHLVEFFEKLTLLYEEYIVIEDNGFNSK